MSGLSTIQAIKLLASAAPAKDWGDKPQMRWLASGKLMIDRSYQRDVLKTGSASIQRIVENFRWSRFGVLLVSDRGNGRYAVVDGQHRTVAALILGIVVVPCLVIQASIEEEAQAFAAINGAVTRLHALQIFHARIVAGDRGARAVMALCDSCGVTVPRNPGLISKPGETLAIGSLQSALKAHGEKVLSMALKAVVGTGGGNTGLLKPAVIQGLPDALSRRKAWQRSQASLNDVIEHASIEKMLGTVARIRALDGGSGRALFAQQVGKALDKAA